jgi:hypothetical protein
VIWLSITWDIPDSPRAPFQPRSYGRYGDAYSVPGFGLFDGSGAEFWPPGFCRCLAARPVFFELLIAW